MHVEMRPIKTIGPYENNPRINDAAVDAVVQSIREFGFRQPIVVDEDGVIIVGHTRYKAALKLGLETVPVHVAVGLSPAQAKAYRIADNQTATLSAWDDDKLSLELAQLQGMDFDLNLTGFSAEELMRLLDSGTNAGQTDSDAVPEPPDEPITLPGDLWLLGKHRLQCGDSSKAEDVDRLLSGAAIHLVNTDPPYNVKVEPRSNNAIAAGLSSFPADARPHYHGFDLARDAQKGTPTTQKLRTKDRPLKNDFVSDEEFDRLLHAWFGNLARVLLPGRCFYIWGGYANCSNYPPVLKATGLYFSQAIIWDKQHPVLTRKDYMGAHEWCFYGWREGAAHQFFGPNNATDSNHDFADDGQEAETARSFGPGTPARADSGTIHRGAPTRRYGMRRIRMRTIRLARSRMPGYEPELLAAIVDHLLTAIDKRSRRNENGPANRCQEDEFSLLDGSRKLRYTFNLPTGRMPPWPVDCSEVR
ncbi:MAG TPA: ParB N-terminal domain-containing protein [Gemmataceae bacterium]|nr:ParB N-terminal domain-containing protein [Gemmataceae bacterium]